MTANYTAIIILIAVTIVAIVSLCIAMIVVYHIHKKEIERITTYEINVGAVIDEEIPNILEKFASNIFTDYRLKFLDMQYMGVSYISNEQQMEIIKEFTNICSRRLSPAMMDKLSLFWKRESITEVLADKIYLIVVEYVASHNAVKNSENKDNIAEKTNIN